MTHRNCVISTTAAQVHSVHIAHSHRQWLMTLNRYFLSICLLADFNRLKLSGIEAATAQKCSLLSPLGMFMFMVHTHLFSVNPFSRTHAFSSAARSNVIHNWIYQFCTFIYLHKEREACRSWELFFVWFGLWFVCTVYTTTATTVQCAQLCIVDWKMEWFFINKMYWFRLDHVQTISTIIEAMKHARARAPSICFYFGCVLNAESIKISTKTVGKYPCAVLCIDSTACLLDSSK